MKVRDLGNLDTDVVLFGGPYSNLQATQALRAETKALGVTARHVICTGDVVAYCADAAATFQEIRDWGCTVVAGNCEKQLAKGAPDCGCGFEEGSICNALSVDWFAHASGHIDAAARAWMAECPDMVVFRHQGQRFAGIHGGLSNISRFLWSTSPDQAFEEEIALIENVLGAIDVVIAGHCGLSFERQIGRARWINAGVIGMPPNDGGPQTRYAVLRAGEVAFLKLTYDSKAAQNAMKEAGLTQGYEKALHSGVWPSQDTLPPELRRNVDVAF